MPVTVVTASGIAAWTAAGNSGPLLNVTGAVFGSTLFTIPDEINSADPVEAAFIASLQTSTTASLGTIVYTANANQIRYRIINNNVVMFQIILDTTVGNFTFGNFGLLCSANDQQYLFTVTALDQSEVKTASDISGLGNYRTYNVLVTLNNVANLSNFTIQIAENASIAEVPTDAALPPANAAPYNLYLVDDYSITNSPALASPVNGAWSFYANLTYVQANYSQINSPQFTGAPTVNANPYGNGVVQTPMNLTDSSGAIPNTQWVQGVAAQYAPLSGAAFIGNISAPIINALEISTAFASIANAQIYTPSSVAPFSTNLDLYCDQTPPNDTHFIGNYIRGFRLNITNNIGSASARWLMVLGAGAETGGNSGSDFSIGGTADDGVTYLGNAISIKRSTSVVDFQVCPIAPSPPPGDVSQKLVTTSFLTGFGGNVPVGGIVMFNSLSGIPANWRLCDGEYGTPDLRNRFIMGAGNVSVGLQGGYSSQTTATDSQGTHSHSGSDGAVILTIDQMPAHSHQVSDPGHSHQFTKDELGSGGDPNPVWAGPGFSPAGSVTTNTSATGITIGSTGSNSAHSHTISPDGLHYHNVNSWDNRPPFYALAFIMRVA